MAAITYKPLAYASITYYPSPTIIYVVPANTQTIISSIIIINNRPVSYFDAKFRIWIGYASPGLVDKCTIYYDQLIKGDSTSIMTLGITLSSDDRVWAFCSTFEPYVNPNLTITLFGIEIT